MPVHRSILLKSQSGAAALEFALVALPLFVAVLSIVEVMLVVLTSSSLAEATTLAARSIRTGQLQKSGSATSSTFAQEICSNMSWLGPQCASNLSVDARVFSSFGSVTPPPVVSNGLIDSSALSFNMGNAGDIVVVRAYYRWPLMTPFLAAALGAASNGVMVITSTAAFRNEPFS